MPSRGRTHWSSALKKNATRSDSHVAIVELDDYFDFISDETKHFGQYIFDWNVRDYEGDVEVNREIRESLGDNKAPEFWWLNNGVTVDLLESIHHGKDVLA